MTESTMKEGTGEVKREEKYVLHSIVVFALYCCKSFLNGEETMYFALFCCCHYLFLIFPQDFEVWVNDTAEHGFVVVSFGAGVKYLSHDIAHKLAGALARLPQRVIWR